MTKQRALYRVGFVILAIIAVCLSISAFGDGSQKPDSEADKLRAELQRQQAEVERLRQRQSDSRQGSTTASSPTSRTAVTCGHCGGRGSSEIQCDECKGKGDFFPCGICTDGRIKPLFQKERICDFCAGSQTRRCSSCNGTGRKKLSCYQCSGTGSYVPASR